MRVSTVPTMHGESVVMRILDKGGVALDFKRLGFEDDTLKGFLDVLMEPHGILLVTGPTGSGQDDDALHGARPAEQARRQNPDRRGSGRISDAGDQSDPGQAADRSHLRQRAALDRAPGSRRDHDRRDTRSRDRADRGPVGADRPPRALDRAHQRCREHGQPFARHGRGRLPADLDGDRHPGAAAGAHAVPELQGVVHSAARGRRRARTAQVHRGQRRHALPRQGLQGVREDRVSRPRQHHGDAADERSICAPT